MLRTAVVATMILGLAAVPAAAGGPTPVSLGDWREIPAERSALDIERVVPERPISVMARHEADGTRLELVFFGTDESGREAGVAMVSRRRDAPFHYLVGREIDSETAFIADLKRQFFGGVVIFTVPEPLSHRSAPAGGWYSLVDVGGTRCLFARGGFRFADGGEGAQSAYDTILRLTYCRPEARFVDFSAGLARLAPR